MEFFLFNDPMAKKPRWEAHDLILNEGEEEDIKPRNYFSPRSSPVDV